MFNTGPSHTHIHYIKSVAISLNIEFYQIFNIWKLFSAPNTIQKSNFGSWDSLKLVLVVLVVMSRPHIALSFYSIDTASQSLD